MSVQIDLSVENGRVEETFDTTSRSTNFTILSRVFANTVHVSDVGISLGLEFRKLRKERHA